MRVIYAMADSLRRDHVGTHGSPPRGEIYTPNIDRFAQSSAVFDRAHVDSFPTVRNRRDTFLGYGDKGLPLYRWKALDAASASGTQAPNSPPR
jgi:hypothetical protein